MNLTERIKNITLAIQLTRETFELAELNYILIKPDKGRTDFIMGVSSLEGNFVFMPYHKTSVIEEDKIQYKRKYRELFDESIEGYILLMLEKGYSILWMGLDYHYYMWDFIDFFIDVMDEIPVGISSYVRFCKDNGITKKVIENLIFESVNDIVGIFNDDIIDEYKIILSETIGEEHTILAYKLENDSNTHELNIIYRVVTLEDDKIIREDFHRKIDNAFIDYSNRITDKLYHHYLYREMENKVVVKQFKQDLERKGIYNGW